MTDSSALPVGRADEPARTHALLREAIAHLHTFRVYAPTEYERSASDEAACHAYEFADELLASRAGGEPAPDDFRRKLSQVRAQVYDRYQAGTINYEWRKVYGQALRDFVAALCSGEPAPEDRYVKCPACGSPEEIFTKCGKCGEEFYTPEQSLQSSRVYCERTGTHPKKLRRRAAATDQETGDA